MSSKSVAVAYAFLMLASALPTVEATHIDGLTPDIPTLPHARPTDECAPTTSLDDDILVRVNQLAAGDAQWYQTDLGVPALCIAGGTPPEYIALIQQLDAALDNLRNASHEVQRQVDMRLEHTLPDSAYPNDLVEPRTVLLDERFDGRRYTGFGEWEVVTEKGEEDAFSLQTSQSVNGTRTVYRFGDDQGYERGAHQWLVSPEIDLTALKGNETAVRDLEYLRTTARNQLYTTCNDFSTGGRAPPGQGDLAFICGRNAQIFLPTVDGDQTQAPPLDTIVQAYEMAIDSTVYELPVMQHGAFMDLTYRFNMAPGEDGVRLWVYAGDRAPDRRVLFHEYFGHGDANEACAYRPATDPLQSIAPVVNSTLRDQDTASALTCDPDLTGAQVLTGLPGMIPTRTFRQGAPDGRNNTAFSGNMTDFTTARVNLTQFMGDRVWLLFEVKTERNDRGVDIFSDPGRFGRMTDFGFELARVYVEGDAWHRNLRLKEVGATFDHVSPNNDEGDTEDVRIAIPPGNEPVVVWVHNAGDYQENATLTVSSGRGVYRERLELIPDEVRAVKIPWGRLTGGGPIQNDTVYHLNASLAFITNDTPTLADITRNGTDPALDPNATAQRPVNAASLPLGAGVMSLYQAIRADTVRDLAFIRADGARGNPVQLCSDVVGSRCEEHYAGRKGEPRTILVGLRNDGNAPQDASVDLKLELEGIERPDMVLGSPTRHAPDLLPGETRALEWEVVPTLPGSYRVILVPHREGALTVQDPLAERLMFVQRSTGLLCLDTLEARECGATFEGGFVDLLREESITASALGADGTLYAATAIAEMRPDDGVHSGQLAARDPTTGAWRILANMSATVLNQTFGEGPTPEHAWGSLRAIVPTTDGSLYLFGDNATMLKWNTSRTPAALERLPLNTSFAHFATALSWNGTLLAGGSNGTLVYLNSTTQLFEPIPLWNTSVDLNDDDKTYMSRYDGYLTDLVVAPGGQLVVIGSDGLLLRHSPADPLAENGTWTETKVDGKLLAWAVGNVTLEDAQVYDGRLYVGGGFSTLLVSARTDATAFRHAVAPAPVDALDTFTWRSYEHLFVEDGRLHVLDTSYSSGVGRSHNLASCAPCHEWNTSWAFELLPLPTRVAGTTHLAGVYEVLSDGERATFLGEAGLVLDRVERGEYENELTWTTVPALAPHDGGVFQTKRNGNRDFVTRPQSYIGVPDEAGRAVAAAASSYRVFLNHSVANATAVYPAQIKLMYRPVLDTTINGVRVCDLPPPSNSNNNVPSPGLGTGTVCYDGNVRYTFAEYKQPTPLDGWQFQRFDDLPTSGEMGAALGAQDPVGLFFYALEFRAHGGGLAGVRWAIDDVHMQGLVDGKWQTILLWRGPADSDESDEASWFHSDLENFLQTISVPAPPADTLYDTELWEEWETPFDLSSASPWHITTQYADRPIFAANNEFYPGSADPAKPRLLNGWNSRLVTPIIDLSDAYDPQLVFRHNYSFRTRLFTAQGGPVFTPGDGGTIEVQYLQRGAECGSDDERVTCGWSRFFTIEPDGGYPTAAEMGLGDRKFVPVSDNFHPRAEEGRIEPGRSFWGRLAIADETGYIGSPRDTDGYKEIRVTLDHTRCNDNEIREIEDKGKSIDCVYSYRDGQATPVNLTGRQVRFAFHLHTLTYPHGESENEALKWDEEGTGTFPGEGWYITDVSVRGAAKLGIDLRASGLGFPVGYDVKTIGVGPGTRVPVNVTIENRGAFDVLGYTGQLSIRRVLDRSLGLTQPVETIALPQQPVLDAGGKTVHTLFWSVPPTEGAEYVLEFEVVPVGIARDESYLDNFATLGSTASPVLAKTVRRFNAEFLVSPENATADITRYIPMFINNTGNVPLEGFTVERRISAIGTTVDGEARTCAEWQQFLLQGRRSAIVDCREWTTARAAPPGARTPLTLLSDDVNPTDDLFWKAPQRASFLVSLSAETRVGSTLLSSGTDKRINAFATYLFDDVESGVRGESIRGSWVYGPGWNVSQPGFRSTDAYAFGDTTLGRYAPEANDSIVSPTIELGSARTARVAFYHNFELEPSFDGGLIEASADGGQTWTALTPISDPLASASYNLSYPLQASSALHPTGDPESSAYAFTSSSDLLPGNVNGWTLSQLDLTSFSKVTEADVAYEAYTSVELGGLALTGDIQVPGTHLYRASTWCLTAEDARCWEVENLTAGLVSPLSKDDPENTFWWSGSPSMLDDAKRPLQNYLLEFEVDLSQVDAGEAVIAEWWEYASRFGGRALFLTGGEPPAAPNEEFVLTDYTYHHGTRPGITSRFNLGEPKLIEKDGKWYHMRADLSELAKGRESIKIGFAYTPIKEYAGGLAAAGADYDAISNRSPDAADATDYFDRRFENDPGFAIDGLTVKAVREARGVVLSEDTLLDERASASVFECGVGGEATHWAAGGTAYAACLDDNAVAVRNAVPDGLKIEGRSWNLVPEIPDKISMWQLVDVRDPSGRDFLPTGERAKAWWTGDIECRGATLRCPSPGSESRLITPAIDLGRIAGDNAKLSFWHRFGFFLFNNTDGGIPLASGGVVEIQEFDAQSGEWSDWKQIYSSPDMGLGWDVRQALLDSGRGGYTAVTSNVSRGSLGVARFDPPFEDLRLNDGPDAYQFLYSGQSYDLENMTGAPSDGRIDGWLQEQFDVTPYIGKRVRFAFHYALSDWPAHLQSDDRAAISDPDGNLRDDTDEEKATPKANDRGGWWISDIKVVGDVLVGQPVQLRWRAGTDGNVHDGGWLLDDIGVFGSRYKENVGIFFDTTPKKYGAYEGNETVIPVTIRNLGESVRRDLAIEVLDASDTLDLQFHGAAPGGNETIGKSYFLKGFTLAPGQSTTVDLHIRTPRSVGTQSEITVLLRLGEQNPLPSSEPSSRFKRITDNDVQGLLQRELVFGLQRKPLAVPETSVIRQVTPELGEPVELELVVSNPGYGPTTLTLTCVAQTVTEHVDTVHPSPTGPDTPIVAEDYDCVREGALTIPAKSSQTYVFRATPTEPGYLSFEIKGSIANGENFSRRAGVAVGVTPFAWREGFDRLLDVTDNFTGTGTRWSYLRGNDAPGALLIGVDENDTDDGYAMPPADGTPPCGGQVCRARSEIVDLHNYSAGSPAFLSFWHMDRLARHDGAQVRARILLNEQKPGSTPESSPSSWSDPCILRPIGGYEGRVRQIPMGTPVPGRAGQPPVTDPGDTNPAFADGSIYPAGGYITPVDFFVADGGQWEDAWDLAVFDLSSKCEKATVTGQDLVLAGKTVRFEFDVYAGGTSMGKLSRGLGHGWLIDDITVSPYAISVRPLAGQRAAMLDNTTKTFNVLVKNLGATPDIVRLEFDALNSSAPEGSVAVPEDAYVLMPGETKTLRVAVTLPRDPSLLPTDFKARVLARSTLDRNAVGATVLELAFGPRQWAELALTVEAPTGIVQEGTEAFIPITIENVGLVESVPSRVLVVDTWPGGRIEHSLDLAGVPSYQQDADGAVRVLEFRWRPEKGSVGEHTLTFTVDPDALGEEYTRSNNLATLVVPVSDLLIPDLVLDDFSALGLRNAAGGTVTPAFDADVARYEVTAGEIVSFEVKVANHGRAGATNVDVRAFIGSLSLPPKQVPYVAPGSEAVVTFVWLAQKGEHNVEFLARSEQVELSIENNRYPGVGVTLLTVKGYEVEVEVPALEGLLEPGTETTFRFSISNSGNAGEDLVLRATSPPGTRVLLPREGFYLRPGETYTGEARLLLDAEAVAGEQFISVDAIARENPMKVASGRAAMRVNASYGGSVVGGVGYGAPTEIELPIELVNEGNSLEPWTVMVSLPAGWSAKETLPAKVRVPAHDRALLTLHVSVPAGTAPGDRIVPVKATMPNGEAREGRARIQVSPLRAAGVVVTDEAPTPERGALNIPIVVENKGNVKQPFSVLLTSSVPGVELRVTPDTFDLEPGAKAVAALVVKPNATVSAGMYAVTGYTRFEGVVAATHEGLANVQTLRVPIVRQDLAAGALEMSPRANVEPGDRVSVKVPVHNRGLTALAAVPVHLFVDDVFVAETILTELGAGARVDATFNWTALEGIHTLTAVVDPYEDTVDADRADNAVSQLATVGDAAAGAGGVAAGRADTPGVGLVGLLAALAVGILMTRGNGSRRQRR